MPNYCEYEMNVIGYPSSVGKFIEILNINYDYNDIYFLKHPKRHMYRIFEANVDDVELLSPNILLATISGYCAWSVTVCMLNGPYSYNNRPTLSDTKSSLDYISKGSTLETICKDLNICVEMYSDEPSMCFQEHILVDNYGNIIINDMKSNVSHIFAYSKEDFQEYYPEINIAIYEKYKNPNDGSINCTINGWPIEEWDRLFTIKYITKRMASIVRNYYIRADMARVINENDEYKDIYERSRIIDDRVAEFKQKGFKKLEELRQKQKEEIKNGK